MSSGSQDSGGDPQPIPKRQKTSDDDDAMLSYVTRQRDGWLSRCYSKGYRGSDDTLVYGAAISGDTMLDEQSRVRTHLQEDFQVDDSGINDPAGCEDASAGGGAATADHQVWER